MSRFSLIGQMQKRIPDTTKYIDTLEQLSAKSQLTGDTRELHKTFVKLFETYNRDAFEENSERLARLLQYIFDKNEEILKQIFSSVSTSSSASDEAKSYLTEKIKEISRQNKEEVSAMAGAIRSDIENRLGDFVREINASIESFKTKYKEQLKKEFSGAQATNVVMPAVSKVLTKDGKTVKASENFEPNIDLDEAKTFTKDTIRREIDSLYIKIKENYSNQISFIALARRSFKDRKKQEAPENAKTLSSAAVPLPVPGATSSSESKTEQKRQQEEQAKFESQVAEEERKKTKNLINETTRLSTTSFRRGTVGEYLKKHRVFAAIVTIPFVVFEIGKRLVTGVFKGVFKLLKGTFDLLIFKPLKFALGFALKFGKVVLGALLGGLTGITKGIKESAKFVGMISKKILAGVWTPVKNAFMMFFKTPMGAYVLGYGVGYIYGKVKKAFEMGTDWMVDFTLEKERQVKEMFSPWLKPIIDTYRGIVDTLKDIYYNQGLKDFIMGVSGLVDWLLEDDNYLRIYNALKSYIGNITSATSRTLKAGAGGMRFAANAGRAMVGLRMVGNASKLAKAIPYVSTAAAFIDIGTQLFTIGSAAMAFTQDPIATKKGGISIKGKFKNLYGTAFDDTDAVMKRVEAQFAVGGRSLTPQEKEALSTFHAELLNEINLIEDYQNELNRLDTLYTDANDAHNQNQDRLDARRPSFLFPTFVRGVLSTKMFGTPFTYLNFNTLSAVNSYKGQINALGRILKIRSEFLNELTGLFVNGNVDKLSTLLKDNNKRGKELVSQFNRRAAQLISNAKSITVSGTNWDTDAEQDDSDSAIKSEMGSILGSLSIDKLGGIERDTTLTMPTNKVQLSTSATGSARMSKDEVIEAVKNSPEFQAMVAAGSGVTFGIGSAAAYEAQLKIVRDALDEYGNASMDSGGKMQQYLQQNSIARGIFESEHSGTRGLTYYKINNDSAHRDQIIRLYCSWVDKLLTEMLNIYKTKSLNAAELYKGGGDVAQPYVRKVTKFIKNLEDKLKVFREQFLAKTNDIGWSGLVQYTDRYGNAAPAVAREIFEIKLEEAKNDLKEDNDEILNSFIKYDYSDIRAELDRMAQTQGEVKAALEIALTVIEEKKENSK